MLLPHTSLRIHMTFGALTWDLTKGKNSLLSFYEGSIPSVYYELYGIEVKEDNI